ncbi:hypothetical protein V1387_03200 [Allomuricauda taeanensis]|uniref:hypothetical protein n=1 Tax=Flagellimonas taeanensis TaxID=1005926 RepID=UPI002E7B6894|nr:hypothetical protein [Allomuricauda taeanensis]MEE1961678.1 hypothetical protein [Allomuricauda taeanensis]
MRLVYTCSVCKAQNYFKPKSGSRADLQIKFGNEVKVNCVNCGKLEKKHINKISAVVDNRIVVGGFIIGLCVLILIGSYTFIFDRPLAYWKFFALAGGTLSGIPVYLWNMENKAVGNFNRYAIRKD